MRKLILIVSSFLLFTSANIVLPGDGEEANAKIKAIYIYNFTKYIEWPDDYKEGSFVIGFIGKNTALFTELSKMADSKKAGNQEIAIKNISTLDDNSKYNIVFILSENSNQLGEVLAKSKGKSTLIVTEKDGLISKGAGINFVVRDSKQKIETNKTNIEKSNLKVAKTLIDLSDNKGG